jgi:hypothetical protein
VRIQAAHHSTTADVPRCARTRARRLSRPSTIAATRSSVPNAFQRPNGDDPPRLLPHRRLVPTRVLAVVSANMETILDQHGPDPCPRAVCHPVLSEQRDVQILLSLRRRADHSIDRHCPSWDESILEPRYSTAGPPRGGKRSRNCHPAANTPSRPTRKLGFPPCARTAGPGIGPVFSRLMWSRCGLTKAAWRRDPERLHCCCRGHRLIAHANPDSLPLLCGRFGRKSGRRSKDNTRDRHRALPNL